MRYLLMILIIFSATQLQAKSLHVGKQEAYKTIHQALQVVADSDSILIHAGLYQEGNLIIDKSISLIGIDNPILDGQYKYEVISIKANYVTVEGITIQHSGISSIIDYAGIKIYECNNVRIEKNIIEDAFFGIYVQYGTKCIIRNNHLRAHKKTEQESGNGIHCWKSDSLQITGNQIQGHRDGIYFEFVTNSIIWRNISSKNLRYGLHFMFSNHDTYVTNVFENNGAGVAVMFSNHVHMYNNYFRENWGDASYGILLKEISDSEIEGNRFEQNTSGIYIEGASRIQMNRNLFKGNGWALKIQASCMEIQLHNNDFIGNTFDVGTNGSLVLNNFNNNYWDKYEGYDLNKDRQGDVPYRPVSMYAGIIEKIPVAMILFRSLITTLMDKSEKLIPSITPEQLKDDHPHIKPVVS